MMVDKVSKEDASAYLQSIGKDAEVSGGVVVVYVPREDVLKPKAMSSLRKTLAGIGYTASCGLKPKECKDGIEKM